MTQSGAVTERRSDMPVSDEVLSVIGAARKKGVFRSPRLRPLMAAWSSFYTADLAHFVLIVVVTFTTGGVAAAGAATVLNVLPGGVLGPLTAVLANSRHPQRYLAAGIGARAVVMAVTVVAVLTGAHIAVLLALIVVDSVVSAGVRPLHGALVVRLADTAAEAAAANAASSSLVMASTLIGPALAGFTLALAGIGWAFVLPGALFAVGMVAALSIRVPSEDSGEGLELCDAAHATAELARAQHDAVESGFRAILASPAALAAAVVFVINVVLQGFWDVAAAVVAKERLGLGENGITTMMTLYGAGGVLGGFATLAIVRRRGLSKAVVWSMAGWATTLASAGLMVHAGPVLVLAVLAGAGAGIGCAIAPTLVQRSVAKNAMVSSAASLQSVYLVASAGGATLAPVLIGWIGTTNALISAAAVALAVTTLAWPQLRKADKLSVEDAANLEVIRSVPMWGPMPVLTLEQLARAATRVSVPAGSEIVRQGNRGNRFYMIAAGLADVTVDGRRVATLGPGGSFGEIAILHDVPRTATVTAREGVVVIVIDRAEFLGALSSTAAAVAHISGVARTRLATVPLEDRLVQLDADNAQNGDSLVDLLASHPPLADIDPEAVREMTAAAEMLAASDGAVIIREGDHGEHYYVILDGSVEVLEGGSAVRKLHAGDGFGEQEIVHEIPRTATVRALGETRLVALAHKTFGQARLNVPAGRELADCQ